MTMARENRGKNEQTAAIIIILISFAESRQIKNEFLHSWII